MIADIVVIMLAYSCVATWFAHAIRAVEADIWCGDEPLYTKLMILFILPLVVIANLIVRRLRR